MKYDILPTFGGVLKIRKDWSLVLDSSITEITIEPSTKRVTILAAKPKKKNKESNVKKR